MGFVKVIKNKAYFKRYQVKYRRRREGKTDYRQRQKLVTQDKNKYKTPKHRLVVRFSNRYVLCQIVRSELTGDRVVCMASSAELPRYGLKVGLKNYSAGYCTGLLIARRLLKSLGMDEMYKGSAEVDGLVKTTEHMLDSGRTKKHWVSEVDEERRPFRCYLDVGTRATTTGARVFGALKGASDGGLDIPHNEKRFPGYDRGESKESASYSAEVHRDRIFGAHVANHMRQMQEEEPEKYQREFADYIKHGVTADNIEDVYSAVHDAIRENPAIVKQPEQEHDKTFKKARRRNLKERRNRIKQKKVARMRKLARAMEAAAADDSEEEEDDE